MTSSRTPERWTTIAALFVLIGQVLLPGAPARAAVGPDALLQPTPLVLKDGRIANVSIHELPFESGHGQLAGNVASRLNELTATVATDCFLTAQVIGHVSSREVAENDTLAAHRLARSRADAVQASLIGGGLPAKSIASVWDWQFLVREPRATLWVFRLVQGEDCEGQPLEGSGSQLVARNEAGEAVAEATPAREAARAQPATPPPAAEDQTDTGPDLGGVVGSAVAAEATPRPEPAETAAAAPSGDTQAPARDTGQTRAAPASPPQPETARAETAPATAAKPADQAERAVAASPAPDPVSTLTRPLPALSPSSSEQSAVGAAKGGSGETAVAAVEPKPATGAGARRAASGDASQGAGTRQQSAARQDPERQGKVEWGQDNVVITFATNSSYFPPGTSRRLATLLRNLAADERYRVRLEVGVSGSDTVVGASTPEEARRYNRWLAERRMGRVREWLDDNAGDRQLEIAPTFQADDNSRRVVVRIAPIS